MPDLLVHSGAARGRPTPYVRNAANTGWTLLEIYVRNDIDTGWIKVYPIGLTVYPATSFQSIPSGSNSGISEMFTASGNSGPVSWQLLNGPDMTLSNATGVTTVVSWNPIVDSTRIATLRCTSAGQTVDVLLTWSQGQPL